MFIRCLEIIDLYSTWSNQSNFSFHLPIWLFRSCCAFNSWNFINYMETSLFLDRNVLNYSHTTVFQSHPALFDARGDHYVLGVFCFVFFNILYFFWYLPYASVAKVHAAHIVQLEALVHNWTTSCLYDFCISPILAQILQNTQRTGAQQCFLLNGG